MDKNLFLFLALLISTTLLTSAQVGINTTTPANDAILDISSSDKGVLVPRMSLTDLGTIAPITGGATESLLVYNTNSTTGKGFYFWNGSTWEAIGGAGGTTSGWTLTGNSGTDSSTDFLGTSDATDLIFRTDNTTRLTLSASGELGVDTPLPNAGVDITRNSTTGSSLEVDHSNTSNNSSAVYIRNSGTNRGLHVVNLAATGNTAVSRFYQAGNGSLAYGSLIEMSGASTAPGLFVNQPGTGVGMHLNKASNGIAAYTNLSVNGGTGSYINLDNNDGIGYYISSTDTGGGASDTFGVYSNVETATPSSGGTINGAAFAGVQDGVGNGLILTHNGSQGVGGELNMTNASNSSTGLLVRHQGSGNAVVAVNDNNTLSAAVSVGDFSYTGTDVDDHIGAEGTSTPAAGWGIGVLGTGGFYGVFSQGDSGATGTKTFLADHPLEPDSKLLRHFSVESDEVLNLYRGVVQLDSEGSATVTLPDYFSAINRNISYQLTGIGTAQSPYVLEEVENNRFVVGGAPNTKVSWMILSERNDAYMQMHPEKRNAVVEKEGSRRGKYVTPEYYQQSSASNIFGEAIETEKNSRINPAAIPQQPSHDLPPSVQETSDTPKRKEKK